jgi:CRP-like cAMP-binding protein
MYKETSGRYATWEEFSQDLAQFSRQNYSHIFSGDFSDNEKIESLHGLGFFAEFPDAEIFEILPYTQWRSFSSESVILRDGEPSDFFCILLEGQARLSKNGKVLSLVTAGESFGEIPAINKSQRAYSADFIALTDVKIIMIRNEALRQVSEACRIHFYQALLEAFATRLALMQIRLSS